MRSDRVPPFSAGEQHQRRRLVDRELLAAAYEKEYGSAAVSEYALEVRDLVERCPEFGPVDTWSKLAERIRSGRPARDRKRWRKKLSRHFTTESKGPPWQTVELVVRHTVPEHDRGATLHRLGLLYEAARQEKPPAQGGEAAEAGDGNHPRIGDGTVDDRARQRIASLERMLAASRGKLAASQADSASSKRKLAASQAENHRLRAQLRAAGRQAGQGPPRNRPLGEGPAPKDVPRQRESSAYDGLTRAGRNPGKFDAPALRAPRLDQVWLTPGDSRTPAYQLEERTTPPRPFHTPAPGMHASPHPARPHTAGPFSPR